MLRAYNVRPFEVRRFTLSELARMAEELQEGGGQAG